MNGVLDFQDTVVAFADKTDKELRDKELLFRAMSSPALVGLGTHAANLAFGLHLPIGFLVKATIFGQFCGGENIAECERVIKKLGASKIGTILDYAPEGKNSEGEFDRTKAEVLRNIERAKGDPNIPFAVFKPTGVAPFDVLEKVTAGEELNGEESARWSRAVERIRELCGAARSLDQPLFIDAEDYSVQKAIDDVVEAMMIEFNKDRPLVYHTVQMYRTDRLQYLKDSHQRVRAAGSFYGIKLVRGAYMERERARAAEHGYASPIHVDKAGTDRDYDAAIDYCLENIANMAFVNATHNEKSTQHLVAEIQRRGLETHHPHVYFSQLFGMSDNLSYVLAANGYNVSKYVPYGPVKDAIPYLSRRAQENTAVMGQVGRELVLIQKEIKRRKQG